MSNTKNRNCYCGSISRELLEKDGIPDGYCGICERCGKPGHTQHFPGPVPYTGAWCDKCLKITARMYWVKVLLVLALPCAVLYALVTWLRS